MHNNVDKSHEIKPTYQYLRHLSLPTEPSDSEDTPKKRTRTDSGSGNWYPIGRITPPPGYFDLESGEKLLTSRKKDLSNKFLNVTSLHNAMKTDTQHVEQSSYVASTVWDIVDPKGIVRGLPSDSPEASVLTTGIVSSNCDESLNVDSEPSCKISKEWTLIPPCDGNVPLPIVERPLGCKTVSVDGLPRRIKQYEVKEIFRECGKILSIKYTDSFVLITFQSEHAVDKALKFNGYKYKVSDKYHWESNRNVIRVDFVPVWAEQQDYIRKIEVCKVKEETRKLTSKLKKKDCSSPMPLNTEFSYEALLKLSKKIRGHTSISHITDDIDLLVRWMEEGKCNQSNCSKFYEALMSIESSIPKLLTEREKLIESVHQTKELLKAKYSSNSLYFAEILKAYNVATSETVLNNFTPEMRPKLESWKMYMENKIEINSRDMINAHSNSWNKIFAVKERSNLPNSSTQNLLSEQQKSEIINLQAENNRLKTELKVAHQETLAKIKGLIGQSSDELKGGNQQTKNISTDNLNKTTKITEREARLIASIGPFLNFHRSGANTESICRHLVKIDPTVTTKDLVGLMRKLPKAFKEESVACADISETKWTLLGI